MKPNTTNIVLIGMPGCGKSLIGTKVAKFMHRSFCDLDKLVENREGQTIPQLFEQSEAVFRQAETAAAQAISHEQSLIISTGGGIILRPENMECLKRHGTIFYIERSVEMILATSDLSGRPLLADDRQRIYRLFEQRQHLYERYADFRIVNDRSLGQAINSIINLYHQHHKAT